MGLAQVCIPRALQGLPGLGTLPFSSTFFGCSHRPFQADVPGGAHGCHAPSSWKHPWLSFMLSSLPQASPAAGCPSPWFTWALSVLLSPSSGWCPQCLAAPPLGTEDTGEGVLSLSCRDHSWVGKRGPRTAAKRGAGHRWTLLGLVTKLGLPESILAHLF